MVNTTGRISDDTAATVLTGADFAAVQSGANVKVPIALFDAAYQPLDADLTAIAALTTATYGRSLLEAASASAARTLLGSVIGTDVQAYSADLTAIAALAKTDGNIIVGDGTNWVAESGATARTSLGLGTGDSPQFTGIELGHATDTTIARSGAGDITIEGNAIYRAGGTDVAVADGGTGASTAAGARDNLSAFGVVRVQTFTSSGTYTPHADMLYCVIECVGGGGGGGGAAGSSGAWYAASGGGAGGYSRKYAAASDIGASQTVTIGALGAGGTAGANAGSAGGNTSVGALCVANGGSGGGPSSSAGNPSPGAGATAGTGDVAAQGAPGMYGGFASILTVGMASGGGGSSAFGGGAAGRVSAGTAAGNAAGVYGSGGSGATVRDSTDTAAGGNGSAGFVIVTEYCSQ